MAYKDPEQRKRYAKEYRLKHPDYQKKWYRLNLEKQRKYFRDRGRKQWRENAKIRAEAPARAKLYRARRVKRGLPAQSPSVKIWHKNNPDLVRALRRIQEQNRRSRLRADGGKVTKQEWLEVVAMFQSRCAYCGEHFTQGDLEMDHVHPVSRGGNHAVFNIVPACCPCNVRKLNKTLIEFFYLDKLLA